MCTGTIRAVPIYTVQPRSIVFSHREEVLWLYQEGASYIFPDRWERFIAPIPVVERGDMMSAYYRRLVGDNEEVQNYHLYLRYQASKAYPYIYIQYQYTHILVERVV